MYTDFEKELSRIALYSYDYSKQNRTGLPDDWALIPMPAGLGLIPETGFQAYAVINNQANRLVFSFIGTRFATAYKENVYANTAKFVSLYCFNYFSRFLRAG